MSDSVLLATRVEELERRVGEIDRELAGLRRTPAPATTVAPRPAPVEAPRPEPQPEARVAQPPPPSTPAREFKPPREFNLPSIDPADLLGAKALAWAGGLISALGVAFFFVLAVDRGWIGPELRVLFGAIASAAVVGVGVWLHRRFGETYSSLAAVGAGIAGAYVTLLASTARYDLVPSFVALGLAASIAAVALAISLSWSSELVAGLGVVGAATMPGLLAIQDGVTTVGTAFALFMLVVAGLVGLRQSWRALSLTAVAVTLPQVLALAGDANGHPPGVLAVVSACWLFFLALGIAADRLLESETGAFAVAFVVGSGAFAYVSSSLLFGHEGRGIALAVAGATTGLAAFALARTRTANDLATILGAVALAEIAVAAANLFSGPSLAYAWAAEGAVLAIAAARTRVSAFHVAAIAYLMLATLHVLAIDAPPQDLFRAVQHPAAGAPVAVATALALLLLAITLHVWKTTSPQREVLPAFRPLAVLADGVRADAFELRVTAYLLGVLGVVYAGSLVVIALFELRSGDLTTSFEYAHLALTLTWAVLGVAVVAVTSARRNDTARLFAAGWLAVVVVKTVAFDSDVLPSHLASAAFLGVAGALLVAAILVQLLDARMSTLDPISTGALIASVPLALAGAVRLFPDEHLGAALAVVGAAYLVPGLALLVSERHRDFRTVLWGIGFVVLMAAEAIALSGTMLAVVWSATAIAAGAIAVVAHEPRLRIAALVSLGTVTVFAIAQQAPPNHLLATNSHPAAGVAAVVVALLGCIACALLEPHRLGRCDELDESLAREAGRLRASQLWVAGVLAVYAASLGVLELAERTGFGDLHTSFQRGHTGVSALWGLIALALLYFGLARDRRALRLGGFALFGLILAKIFVYDLATLSPAARAVSFLAVGAVFLLGGFFYQRLAARQEEVA